jgi:predicted O-linked N-acetylglucosamine transferase (SPINDLY family)
VRGRYTFGFYRTMQIEDCIALSTRDYIEKAIKLGTDQEWRAHLVDKICERNEILFNSHAAVGEYNRIFERLVDEALKKAAA